MWLLQNLCTDEISTRVWQDQSSQPFSYLTLFWFLCAQEQNCSQLVDLDDWQLDIKVGWPEAEWSHMNVHSKIQINLLDLTKAQGRDVMPLVVEVYCN